MSWSARSAVPSPAERSSLMGDPAKVMAGTYRATKSSRELSRLFEASRGGTTRVSSTISPSCPGTTRATPGNERRTDRKR